MPVRTTLRGLAAMLLATTLLGHASAARAVASTVTFAQFSQNDGSNDFIFNNNVSSASFTTISGGVSISFRYLSGIFTNLPSDLSGFQDATLTMNLTASADATSSNGSDYQPLSGTIAITRNTAAAEGTGSRTDLLTISINNNTTTGALSGANGGTSASISPSTPSSSVTFSSDFLNFNSTTTRNFALSFSSVTPGIAINGNFLQNFAAAGSGTFASDPSPAIKPTSSPEPPAVVLVGAAAAVAGLRQARRWFAVARARH